MRKDFAMDWAWALALGESRWIRDGMREDSAPVLETEPTSS